MPDFLQNKFLKYFSLVLLFGIFIFHFNACTEVNNPCDLLECNNGECIIAVDSVATPTDLIFQTSDTLTQAFRILETNGKVVHQGDSLTLVTNIVVASNVEISRETNIANAAAVINLLTYTTCDCFTGWEGTTCTIPAPCDGVNCLNGGVAVELDESTCECDCPLGFTGNLCETEDKCTLVTCLNNSHCEVDEVTGQAECVCDTGYDFPCIVQTRNKFLGNYEVTLDSCSTIRVPASLPPYSLVVEEDNDNIEQIVFNGFNDFGAIRGKTFNENSISIQDTTDQMTVISSLQGSYSSTNSTINLLLLVTYANGAVDTCAIQMKK